MTKHIKFFITRIGFTSTKCTNIRFWPGLRPADPAGGAYDAPPYPLVGWGGGYLLPIPLPRYGASVLRPPQHKILAMPVPQTPRGAAPAWTPLGDFCPPDSLFCPPYKIPVYAPNSITHSPSLRMPARKHFRSRQ